jgi:peptide chain release factor
MSEIILHLTSGQGPEECRWVVGQLARAFQAEGTRAGISCVPMEPVEGNPATVLLRVSGEGAEAFVQARSGTILWIGSSPFRPHHRRRNWFVGVSHLLPVEEMEGLRDEDIDYQATRASGPGGQHVNKTDSAIRAIHRPTGLATFAQDQRSQHANRKLARLKLALLLAERQLDGQREDRQAAWSRNQSLERGNAVKIYVGAKFDLKS